VDDHDGKTRLRNGRWWRVLIGAFLGVALLATLFYWGDQSYNYPIRVHGRYERKEGSTFGVSPDGNSIVYCSVRTGRGNIYKCDLNGSRVQRLTSGPGYEGDPTYSPDGKWIAYLREDRLCGHIWLMRSDGSNQRELTTGPDYDSRP